jgi:hypothetical protein
MKILPAFNSSKLSEAALHAFLTQRQPENTTVKVLKVMPLDITGDERRQAQASLDLTTQALRTAGFRSRKYGSERHSFRINCRRSKRTGSLLLRAPSRLWGFVLNIASREHAAFRNEVSHENSAGD